MHWNRMCYARRVNLLAVAMLAAAMSVGSAAYAVDKSWTGASSSFASPNAWNPSGQPGTLDTAIFALGNLTPPANNILFLTGQFQAINAVVDRLRIDSSPVNFTPPQSTLTIDSTNITETGRALVIGRVGSGIPNAQLDNLLSSLSTVYGTLGADAGSSGTINVNGGTFSVTGTGAVWDLILGRNGTGTINVNNGADVSVADDTVLGLNAGSVGQVGVSGAGSTWISTGDVDIGNMGDGTLIVNDVGTIDSAAVRLGASTGGTGTASLYGSGTTWDVGGLLTVGEAGSGQLNVLNGAQLTAAGATLGNLTGSTATMLVSGLFAGCTINGPLTVGNFGQASLTIDGWSALFDQNGPMTIEAGGEVEVGVGAVFDLGAQPLTINGGTLTVLGDADVTFGAGSLLNGADVHVSMIQSTLTHTGELAMAGGTSLTVASGAQYRPSFTQVGTSSGTPASVLVTGPGTAAISTFAIDIGYGGAGEFTVSGGASVNAPNSAVGSFAPGSIGTLTIDGAAPGGQRSTWTSNNGPNVGYHATGHGTISVLNGGLLRSSGMDLGDPGTGTMVIDGAASPSTPSLLDMLGSLSISRADVTVSGGGRIQAGDLYLAAFAAGPATLTIQGSGSMLQQNGASTIGAGSAVSSTVDINVLDGGVIDSGTGIIYINSTATMLLDGAALPGTFLADGAMTVYGAVDVGDLTPTGGAAGGVLDINAGLTIDGGTVRLARGTIDANSISLINAGILDLDGGTLHTDTFNGNLLNQGGTLAPGHSVGVTNVSGNYTQQAAAKLQIEIADVFPGDWDQLSVQGNAILNGTLEVALLDGFKPVVGNSFTILTTNVGNVGGTFATVNLPSGMQVTYTATSVTLNVIATPCPADVNNSGFVDVDDLIAVILGWGACPTPPMSCPADTNNSGTVDVDDLIAVILSWGACS